MKKQNKNRKNFYLPSRSGFLKVLPNIITLSAFCCGVTSIRMAIDHKLESAIGFLVLSSIMDILDGRVARMTGQESSIGAELDSLSDLVCFGVAPGLISYILVLKEIPKLGWALSLFYIVCCAFRLAKFNVMLDEKNSNIDYFTGIPAPAGAAFCLLPMQMFLASADYIFVNKYLVATFLILSALCMIGSFKVPSFKHVHIQRSNMLRYMCMALLIILAGITYFWYTLSCITAIYLLCIPVVLIANKNNNHEKKIFYEQQ